MTGILLLLAGSATRFVLSPLWYFLACTPAYIVFTVLRKRFDYRILALAPLIPIVAEVIAILLGNFKAGFLFGDIICIITALLGMGDERPKERLIRDLGLSGAENRMRVSSMFYTFGRVAQIEKVNMSQSYAVIHDKAFRFTVDIPGSGRVTMVIPIEKIQEVSVHLSMSSGELYLPSLRDMFLPARKIKMIGKPKIRDYFLLVRTSEDTYSFYEEPATVLRIQEEIEAARKETEQLVQNHPATST